MSVIEALSKTGWFHRSKKSAENFRVWASDTVQALARDMVPVLLQWPAENTAAQTAESRRTVDSDNGAKESTPRDSNIKSGTARGCRRSER